MDKIENIQTIEVVIIKVKVLKHYKNYFNRNIPYKITVLFNEKKISLIFFSKYTNYLEKIFPLEKEIYIKGKLELYNNNLQISHPEIIDEKFYPIKKYIKVVYKQKKSLKSDVIHSLIIKACNLMPDIEEWNLRLQENFNKIPSFKESIINIHNPLEEDSLSNSSTYITRLAYDEIFAYQLSLQF